MKHFKYNTLLAVRLSILIIFALSFTANNVVGAITLTQWSTNPSSYDQNNDVTGYDVNNSFIGTLTALTNLKSITIQDWDASTKTVLTINSTGSNDFNLTNLSIQGPGSELIIGSGVNLTLSGIFSTNSGNITIKSGGSITFENNATISNNFNLTIEEGGELIAENGFSMSSGSNTLTIAGLLEANSFTVNGGSNEKIDIQGGGVLHVLTNVLLNGVGFDITNEDGSFIVDGNMTISNNGDNTGSIQGDLTVTGILDNNMGGAGITGSGTVTAGGYTGVGLLFGTTTNSDTFVDGVSYIQGSGGTAEPVSITPICLTNFIASYHDNTVLIRWQTASEIDNDYFTVERSVDGSNFDIIGTIQGAGTSYITLNYSFTDNNPANGVSYYRLTQTDYNGEFEVFSPVSVSYLNEGNLKIGPNPATNQLSIMLNGIMGSSTLEIIDISGRLIKTIQLKDSYSTLDITEINSGNYILIISAENKKITKKLIIE